MNNASMKQVWILTAVVALYGFGNGMMVTGAPQASIALHQPSDALGFIGAALPMGYALSCLLCGQLFRRIAGKYVLLSGVACACLSILSMSQAKTVGACVASQVCFGLSGGAFWPFASSWMIDFESDGIPKTRLLRHYNLAWTSGTASGLFFAGLVCQQGYITGNFYGAAAMMSVVFVCACIPRAIQPHAKTEEGADAKPARHTEPLGLALFAAALLANVAALGTRAVIVNNYAELNKHWGFGADRMGLFTAMMILSQLTAFSLGNLYESRLGLRRLYVFIAVSLVIVNISFAYCTDLIVLVPAVMLHGVVLAVAFQAGIIAGLGFFASPRTATTVHEAVVGMAGVAALIAGIIVVSLKHPGGVEVEALRAPFLWLALMAGVILAVQTVLVSVQTQPRLLLRGRS